MVKSDTVLPVCHHLLIQSIHIIHTTHPSVTYCLGDQIESIRSIHRDLLATVWESTEHYLHYTLSVRRGLLGGERWWWWFLVVCWGWVVAAFILCFLWASLLASQRDVRLTSIQCGLAQHYTVRPRLLDQHWSLRYSVLCLQFAFLRLMWVFQDWVFVFFRLSVFRYPDDPALRTGLQYRWWSFQRKSLKGQLSLGNTDQRDQAVPSQFHTTW